MSELTYTDKLYKLTCDGCGKIVHGKRLLYQPIDESGNGFHWDCIPENVPKTKIFNGISLRWWPRYSSPLFY